MARSEDTPRGTGKDSGEKKDSSKYDLQDSPRDEEKLKSDKAIFELPDVKDIPGQEHVHVPPLGELADTTISSADEEGAGVFDDEESDVHITGQENVSAEERVQLDISEEYMPTRDEEKLQRASLEHTDNEGDPLNEASFGQDRTGEDLDVPGASADDRQEQSGAEDEENNQYSLGSDSDDRLSGVS